MDFVRRHVPVMPMDLERFLADVLDDEVVTDDERIDFLHALSGQPMDSWRKGVLREAIEFWAQRDAEAGAHAVAGHGSGAVVMA